MTKPQKVLALILCMAMCLSMLPTWALAEEVNPAEEEAVVELQEENLAESRPSAAFILHTEPEGAYVRVYSLDENGAETDAYPDETGTYILTPGEYCYDVSAEGYQAKQGEKIQLEAAEAPMEITVVLELEVQESEPEEEKVSLAEATVEDLEGKNEELGFEPLLGEGEAVEYSENGLLLTGDAADGVVAEEEVANNNTENQMTSGENATDEELLRAEVNNLESKTIIPSEVHNQNTDKQTVAENQTGETNAEFLEEDLEATLAATGVLPDEIGLLQETSVTCTLATAAMMMRARMYRSDNNLWSSITESSIQPVAWINGQGLAGSWTYNIGGNSISVSSAGCSGMSATWLKGYLDQHPEGIVIYDYSLPHAVFVCDYVGDTFYCFDSNSHPGVAVRGRQPLTTYFMSQLGSQTDILNAIDKYWYVSSYSIQPSAQQPKGCVDSLWSTGKGEIHLEGWAFDPDVPASHLQLHVYVGGDSGSGKLYRTQCNAVYRPDVENAYGSVGAYHGFNLTIPVDERGSQAVYVYAIDEGDNSAGNVLIGSGTINITADYAREISVDPSSMTLGVESTKRLSVSYQPYDTVNKSVTWSSSNTSIATVDSSGLVTGKASGTATITATAAGGAITSCGVTVQATQTKINLDQTEISIPLGSLVEVGLSVTGAPDGAYVKWSPPAGSGAWNGTLILSDQGTAWTIHGKTGEENYYTYPEDKVYIGAGPYSLNYGGNRIKAGTTYRITISCNGASKILQITYVDPVIPVSSLKLNKTRITMALGEEVPLSAVMTPSNTTVDYIYWRKTGDSISLEPDEYMASRGEKNGTVADYQSNTQGWVLYPTLIKTAPIHEAVIKAEALGTSTITVETVGGATATCEVTVVNAIPVSSVSLNRTSLSLIVGRSETLSASVSPTNATDKSLSWSSNNPAVATVSNGSVSAVSPGTAVITASAKNGVKASCTVQVLFHDVADSTLYYYNPVYWAVDHGITTGRTATTFDPYGECTRGHIVTFLWRAFGEQEPTVNNPFEDVHEGDSFYKAVLWAYENGITTGQTATTFGPWNFCTRGQIVTFLWRAMGQAEPGIGNPFTDVNPGDGFYRAVLWAVENGITTGRTPTTFDPWATCTRGQAVTFLYRAMH